MENQIKTIAELIENSAHVAKLLCANEICLNDGDLKSSQKCVMEASDLLNVLTKDVFIEVEDDFKLSTTNTVEYDIPTTLELAKQLNDIVYNSGVLLGLILDKQSESIINAKKEKILTLINTVVEINNAIFQN